MLIPNSDKLIEGKELSGIDKKTNKETFTTVYPPDWFANEKEAAAPAAAPAAAEATKE